MLIVRGLVAVALVAQLISLAPLSASADDGHTVSSGSEAAAVKAWQNRRSHGRSVRRVSTDISTNVNASASTSTKSTSSGSGYEYVSKADYKKAVAGQAAKLSAYKRYQAAQQQYFACAGDPFMSACPRPAGVAAPGQLMVRPRQNPKKGVPAQAPVAPPAPVVSPEEAAYIAFARLRLTPPKPMIGPPPQINEWKMAAVGYPMWLWAEGTLDPAPVSDQVYDLTVSLDAHLVKTTFDMGDGHRLTCGDLSHAWVRGTTPGQPSPSCGYIYTKPSLPQGNYTITAYSEWAVDWSVNGVGGTIPMYQQASTQLPVGELQVLVR